MASDGGRLAVKKAKYLRFSDHFKINRPQSQIDFVDIPLDTDIKLYVDPYALHVSNVDWLRTCGDLVANYFHLLIKSISEGDRHRAISLLSNLREPNETRLGESSGTPKGRGWGKGQAEELYQRLSSSKAVTSGSIKDLSDFELLIPGIGSDKISDLTINVIRGELVSYTQEQCELYEIETEEVPAGVFWNPDEARWEAQFAQLPTYKGKGLILVPKIAVRKRLVPDYHEFYDQHVLPFLEAEHISANDSLVHMLKNGNPKVYKSDLKAKYKLSKEFLFQFSQKHPKVLTDYKDDLPAKAENVIADETIESKQAAGQFIDRENAFKELGDIPTGAAAASKYQDFVIAALTQIFYPALTRPKKEQSVDGGRKRIDIFFHNSDTRGFFAHLVHMHHYHAPYITVECKNYASDLENPEIDQLIGRLNRKRSFVGLLTCRKINDKQTLLKRCQDVVNNNSDQLIIVLDDDDLVTLLGLSAAGNSQGVTEHLEDKLKAILT